MISAQKGTWVVKVKARCLQDMVLFLPSLHLDFYLLLPSYFPFLTSLSLLFSFIPSFSPSYPSLLFFLPFFLISPFPSSLLSYFLSYISSPHLSFLLVSLLLSFPSRLKKFGHVNVPSREVL